MNKFFKDHFYIPWYISPLLKILYIFLPEIFLLFYANSLTLG